MIARSRSLQRFITQIWTLVTLVVCLGPAPVAAQVQDYILLVIGPTSNRIDPVEQRVVDRLKAVRQQSQYRGLAMATMHFDRPKEAAFANQVLGVYRQDLVCVCLARLDPRTKQPAQKVYAVNNVTPETLAGLENTLQGLTSGQLPAVNSNPNVQSNNNGSKWPPSSNGNISNTNNNSTRILNTNANGAQGVWTPDPGRPRLRSNQVYSWEGILATFRQVEAQSAAMWEVTKNSPLRADQSDNPCRQSLLAAAEAARLLRIAAEEGHINPKDRLQLMLKGRDQLRRQQPEYFLPPAVRPNIPALMESFDQIEMIYWQLNP